jgi:hypothetical protein
VLRTPDAAMRTSPLHVYYPWQVFQRWRLRSLEVPPHQVKCNPKMPRASRLSKTGRYHVPSTLARRQHFFVAAQPTGTSPERTMDGSCHYHFKTSFKPGRKCRHRRGLGRSSKDLNRRSCPEYPARSGD